MLIGEGSPAVLREREELRVGVAILVHQLEGVDNLDGRGTAKTHAALPVGGFRIPLQERDPWVAVGEAWDSAVVQFRQSDILREFRHIRAVWANPVEADAAFVFKKRIYAVGGASGFQKAHADRCVHQFDAPPRVHHPEFGLSVVVHTSNEQVAIFSGTHAEGVGGFSNQEVGESNRTAQADDWRFVAVRNDFQMLPELLFQPGLHFVRG